MATIQAVVSQNASYVYHLLSVACIGYDNAYGEQYRKFHPEDDLATLRLYHDLLCVSGGAHIGQLYALLVALPASLDDDTSLHTFYDYILHLFRTMDQQHTSTVYAGWLSSLPERYAFGLDIKDIPLDYYEGFREVIIVICEIFQRNQNAFAQSAWPSELEALVGYVAELNEALLRNSCSDRWQELLECQWEKEHFYAIICNSLRDGPQAIDIADDRDVFQRSGAMQPQCEFISHEFGIYMLKQLLRGKLEPGNIQHWRPIEGLAVLYNQMIWDDYEKHWHADVALVNYYKRLRSEQPSISVVELFDKGICFYNESVMP